MPRLPSPSAKRGGFSLELQCEAMRLPMPVREHRFHETRRWRFDYAWLDAKFAVEVEGGVYVQGRHTRGAGVEADCEKYAVAMTLGWQVLRVTPRQVENGEAANWIRAVLIARELYKQCAKEAGIL